MECSGVVSSYDENTYPDKRTGELRGSVNLGVTEVDPMSGEAVASYLLMVPIEVWRGLGLQADRLKVFGQQLRAIAVPALYKEYGEIKGAAMEARQVEVVEPAANGLQPVSADA